VIDKKIILAKRISRLDSKIITLVEDQWTDYRILISDLASSLTLNPVWIKEHNGTRGLTTYVGNIGLN
jgi:hypothetical protein